LLRYAFALSASGIYHTFPDIATGSLALLLHSLGREGNETAQKEILGTFSRLPAHRDVKPAHEKMKSSNCLAVLLTNRFMANIENWYATTASNTWLTTLYWWRIPTSVNRKQNFTSRLHWNTHAPQRMLC
jgi:hypothetical protein